MHILNQAQVNLIYNTNRNLFLWIEIFICTTDLYNATADRWYESVAPLVERLTILKVQIEQFSESLTSSDNYITVYYVYYVGCTCVFFLSFSSVIILHILCLLLWAASMMGDCLHCSPPLQSLLCSCFDLFTWLINSLCLTHSGTRSCVMDTERVVCCTTKLTSNAIELWLVRSALQGSRGQTKLRSSELPVLYEMSDYCHNIIT